MRFTLPLTFLLTLLPANADTVVFQDLTDTLSVTGTTRVTFSCPSGTETCTASLSAPAGATFAGIEASFALVNIADPGNATG